VAVAVNYHYVARRTVECQTILFDVDVPLVTKNKWSQEKIRSACAPRPPPGRCGRAVGPFVHRIAHVGAQHILARTVEHLPYWALQEGHPARVTGTVPGIRTVAGIMGQRAKTAAQANPGICALHAPRSGDELRRILEHVNKAVQLA